MTGTSKKAAPHQSDRKQQALAEGLSHIERQLRAAEILDGHFVKQSNKKDITIDSSATIKVKHGLGRLPQFWFITYLRGSGNVTMAIDSPSWDKEEIEFRYGGSGTVTFEFYIG